jgi:hypothetical protein
MTRVGETLSLLDSNVIGKLSNKVNDKPLFGSL